MIRHFCDLCDQPALDSIQIEYWRFFNQRGDTRSVFDNKQPKMIAFLKWGLENQLGPDRLPDLCGECLVKTCEKLTEEARKRAGFIALPQPGEKQDDVVDFKFNRQEIKQRISALRSEADRLLAEARDLPVPEAACLRPAKSEDIQHEATLWYPDDDPPCFHIVEEIDNPEGTLYTAEDGCVYGLDGAFVEDEDMKKPGA